MAAVAACSVKSAFSCQGSPAEIFAPDFAVRSSRRQSRTPERSGSSTSPPGNLKQRRSVARRTQSAVPGQAEKSSICAVEPRHTLSAPHRQWPFKPTAVLALIEGPGGPEDLSAVPEKSRPRFHHALLVHGLTCPVRERRDHVLHRRQRDRLRRSPGLQLHLLAIAEGCVEANEFVSIRQIAAGRVRRGLYRAVERGRFDRELSAGGKSRGGQRAPIRCSEQPDARALWDAEVVRRTRGEQGELRGAGGGGEVRRRGGEAGWRGG